MARDSTETRAALLEAGRHLFATEGIFSTPLSSVIKIAGQRNSSALQYHFADGYPDARLGLLYAIIATNNASAEIVRQKMLDDVIRENRMKDLPSLVGVAVLPLAHKFKDPAGREFLSIISQMVDEFNNWDAGSPDMPSAALVTFRLIEQALSDELSPAIRHERVVRYLQMTSEAIGSHARYVTSVQNGPIDQRRLSTPAFFSNLIDMAVGALRAPAVSELSERDLDLL